MRSPRRPVTTIVSRVLSLASIVNVVVEPTQSGADVEPTRVEPRLPLVGDVPKTVRGELWRGKGVTSATPSCVHPRPGSESWSASTRIANLRIGLSLMYVAHSNPLGTIYFYLTYLRPRRRMVSQVLFLTVDDVTSTVPAGRAGWNVPVEPVYAARAG